MIRLTEVFVAVGVIVASSACWEVPPEQVRDAGDDLAPAAPVPQTTSSVPPDTTPLADPCLRGGTPRGDVARIMGEADSVVYGVWFYGASEVHFGYGVVLELRDRGELILCDP